MKTLKLHCPVTQILITNRIQMAVVCSRYILKFQVFSFVKLPHFLSLSCYAPLAET